MRLAPALAAAVALAPCATARAEPPAHFWEVPSEAIASWAVDPGALGGGADRNLALAEEALAWLVPASAGADSPTPLGTLLDRAVLGESAYRLVLLKCEATSPPPVRGDPQPADVGTLEAVLEIEHPLKEDAIITAAQAGVQRLLGAAPTEVPIPLPDGRDGHALRVAGKPASSDLEWFRNSDSLVIGFGRGSVARWLSLEHAARSTLVTVHDTPLARDGRQAVQAWVNLNALRESAPELFAYGRLGPLARRWNLSVGRSLYLSGRSIAQEGTRQPPLLNLSASWNSRREAADAIRVAALTEGWPPDLGITLPDGCRYAAVFRADWRQIFDGCLGTAEALAPSPALFQNQYKRWIADHSSALVQSVKSLRDVAVVIGPSTTGPQPAAVLLAAPEATDFGAHITALGAALAPIAVRNGVSGSFRLHSSRTPPPPWSGLTWQLGPRRDRVEFSWPAPPAPQP